MHVIQLHETFLRDADSDLDARVVSLSDEALRASAAWIELLSRGPQEIGQDLGLGDAMTFDPSDLQAALRLVLDPAFPERWIQDPDINSWIERAKVEPDEAVARFAEFVMYERFIPFSASPLALQALQAIGSLSPVQLGAAAAFAVFVGGASPLLLIAVPTGMLVCGAAAGVSRALEEGLRYRLLRKLAPHLAG